MSEQTKNPVAFGCPKPNCKCTILRANMASLVSRKSRIAFPQIGSDAELELALPSQIKTLIDDCNKESSGEMWFWQLSNMMDFENIGFSKRVDGVQYLSCADCDLAPLGYHDTTGATKEYLVAVDRVKYKI